MSGDPWSAFDPHKKPKPRIANPFPLHRPLRDDEAQIPTRRWVGGEGAFPRGKVVAIAGPPGVSKTTFALGVGVALAAGIPFGGLVEPEAPCRVLFAAIEDELEEIERRAHAIAMAIADTPRLRALVNANLSIVEIADAVPFFHVSPDGTLAETEGAHRLDDTMAAVRPDITFLDPLVELHTAEEGSNTLMRPVLKQVRGLANTHDCTVALLHHETKAGEGTALQRLRGAGAIGGVIRNLLSLRTMTTDEGREFGIDEDNLDLFIKVETGKQQYARKARPRWFVTEERELANGDRAHLLLPWMPPTVTLDGATMAAALTAIRRGLGGEPCSESNNAAASVREALEAVGVPKAAHREVLRRLREAGEIEVRAWYDPVARKWFKRIWTDGNGFKGWRDDPAQ